MKGLQAYFSIDEAVLRAPEGSPCLREIADWARRQPNYDGILAPSAYDDQALTIVIFQHAIPTHVSELDHRIAQLELEHRELDVKTHRAAVTGQRLAIFSWSARRPLARTVFGALPLETLLAPNK